MKSNLIQQTIELFQDLAYYFFRFFFKWLFAPFKQVNVYGLDGMPRGQNSILVFIANHDSILNPLWLAVALPYRFIYLAKHWVLAIPVLGKLFSWLNFSQLAMDSLRGSKTKYDDNISRLVKILERRSRKCCLLAFPEGTTSRSKEEIVGEFKTWPFVLCLRLAKTKQRTKIYLVPVRFYGSRFFLHRLKKLPRPSQKITVLVGEPILANDFTSSEQLKKAARTVIENLAI